MTPITDEQLAVLDAAVERMTPGQWETEAIAISERRGRNSLIVDRGMTEANKSGIVALRNSYASLRERLRVAEAERDELRKVCKVLAIETITRTRSTSSEPHP